MPAECYICGSSESKPRYCCKICGGLFCAEHGSRSDKRSVCNKCLADDIKINITTTKQLITYLNEVKDRISENIKENKYKELKKEEIEELKSSIDEIEHFFKEITK